MISGQWFGWKPEELSTALELTMGRHLLDHAEGLRTLWAQGFHVKETYEAHMEEERRVEDIRNNVILHPREFQGWEIDAAILYKPGVYRFWIRTAYEWNKPRMGMGFCRQDVLRVALEQKICTRAKR